MPPYSLDLRQKVVESYENKEGSIRTIAKRFKVSKDFVQRLLKRYQNEGTIEPKPYTGGNQPKLKSEQLQILITLVEEDNDATNSELAEKIVLLTGILVSASTISRALKKLNITRKKKSLKAAEAYSESKQLQRYDYWNQIKDIKVEDLVFLDETGVNLAMISLYARATKGQRAYGTKPVKKGKNVSILGAMSLNEGFLAGFSFDGGTNGDIFLWFIENVLVPQLWMGAVVVMDNLPAHKVIGVTEAIEAVGAKVIYLSPYSPDFNPIEHLWSKLKAFLRKVAARTKDILHDAIRDGLNLISLKDVRNWFTHCCYYTE